MARAMAQTMDPAMDKCVFINNWRQK
jgi:hypothetical protein